ncbi:MAG: aminotransferase class V-fold PLP-dependent enzyme [Candidatus Tectomicrobia bacterium]|uniref:Aminotransferase class V-fold PLP-dependent enzyme n=1 Tax=Tectimicrobiota bacterium TaxID=2528274 RepID=A0A937W0P7_UNCTE|nr:aminotransferase class V-fold PLP-dependent enzyme [Candidatus Tectomicrobia bacterium]
MQSSLSQIRDTEFPIVRDYTYLNTASQGPWPNRTVRAVQEAAAAMQYVNTPRGMPETAPATQLARERLARLLNAHPEDIVFTSNTTHGLNIVAQGIAWQSGDNCVVPRADFPSLSYTWCHLRERGVEVRFVPWTGAGPSVETLMAAVDTRTRVVACSAIKWDTGYRVDLEALGARCAARGVLLVVDAIQAVGAQPIDVQAARISALATHGYKWLMAGFGVGALYVAPEALEHIRPTFVGSQSVVSAGEGFEEQLPWQPNAQRYAAGGLNTIGLTALASSLGLVEEIGIHAIAEHGSTLAALAQEGLQSKSSLRVVSDANPAHRSAIVVFTTGAAERDAKLVQELAAQGIIVALRPLGLRISPHVYNTEADITRLLAALPG